MNNKKGVSLIFVISASIIMMVIITSASIAGATSIAGANFEEYKSSLGRIQSNVNMYFLSNNKLPITNNIVSSNSLGQHFYNNITQNGDENNRLFVVNMDLINNTTIKRGYGTVNNRDVYLVAENSHNVYYLKGFKFRGQVVYGL